MADEELFLRTIGTVANKKNILKGLLGLFLVAIIASCSSVSPEKLSAKERLVSDGERHEPVFAELQKQGKAWRFVHLSKTPPQDDFYVELDNMVPGNLPHKKDTVRGLMGLMPTRQRHSLLPVRDPLLQYRPDIIQMAEMYTLGLVIVIPGSALGTVFSVFSLDSTDLGWVLPMYGTSAPREYSYERIIAKAKLTDKLNSRWVNLQQQYDALVRDEQQVEQEAKAQVALYEQQYDRIDSDRAQRINQKLLNSLQVSFDNQSGWNAPSPDQLKAWIRIASIEPLKHPAVKLSPKWPEVFPAENIEDFQARLNKAKEAYALAKSQLDQQLSDARSYVTSYSRRALLDDARIRIDHDFLADKLQGWQYFEPTLPGDALLMKGGAVRNITCYCVTLKARQFFHVIPPTYHMADDRVSVDWDGHSLVVLNQSKQMVAVDRVEIDFNGQSSAQDTEKDDTARLAPGSLTRIKGLDHTFDGSSFIVSREQAAKIQVPFYVKVQYHDVAKKESYRLANFNALNLLTMLQQMDLQ